MRRFLSIACLLLIAPPALAQNADVAVRTVIDTLFDAMRAADSTAARAVFSDGARLVTTGFDDEGLPSQRVTPVAAFVAAVGSPRDAVWDERIWDVVVDVRDNLASAWMPYAFFRGGILSHCGVNHFQLARERTGAWRVVALADTRSTADCDLDADKVEESAVRSALGHYLRGHATGDGSHHEQAFHPVSSLYWVRDGDLAERTSEAYIAGAPGAPAPDEADRVRFIDWVEVTGTAAVARVVLDYPSATFVDYMSLLKLDGRWQIVNKTFHVDTKD